MPDRARQVEELCHAALERPADLRAAFLSEATAGDVALLHEVESRLARGVRTESLAALPFSNSQTRSHSGEATKSADSTLSSIGDSIEGKLVSHYRILQTIGAGGMGVVYRAHDERLDRDVALKVLPGGSLSSDAARNRFRKEALALAKLNHPHIGAIYDFDQQDGTDFLVMEYVPGKTLAHELALNALPESAVLSLGTQIVAALAEAHSKGIIHRDLKPGNIVVTPHHQAKVLDFGVAKLLDPSNVVLSVEELDATEPRAGTLPYMAPEQLRGIPADSRTDIYAVGTLLYEMTTRQRPFRAKSTAALASDIQTQLPTPPRQLNPRLSPSFEQLILKCLEKKPESRYQSATELLADLQRLEAAQSASAKAAERIRRRRVFVTIASLAVLLTATYPLWKSILPFKPASKITLAVLPFENLSRNPQEDYFCDGLTDEMINRLGRLAPQRLGVIARTSAMRYKNTDKSVGDIGRELGVNYILETGVQREGQRIRISTALIQVRDQTSLWTQSYDYDLAGVFGLQSDIADRIARSLALQLLPQQPPSRTDPQAFDAYLRGLYHWHKGSADERSKAREYFERSIELDPNFAPGYANLAGYYSTTGDLPPNVATPKAKEYALRAIALDDSLTQAHTALANVRFYGDWDWAAAETDFKRALQLNPNDAEAHRTYSNYLLAMGRFDEAFREIQSASDLDPLSLLLTSVNEGWTFYFARQYDRAIEQCRKALELDANSDGAHSCLSWSYRAKGMGSQAVAEAERSVSLSGRNTARLVGLARAYAANQQKAEAAKILDELAQRAKTGYVSSYALARISISLGDRDRTFADLNRAFAERDSYLVWLKVDEAFDPLRTDPRFQDLLHRVGFPG